MHTSRKRTRTQSEAVSPQQQANLLVVEDVPPSSSHVSKKLKIQASYATTSPFPDYTHPTVSEARDVHSLLAQSLPGKVPIRAKRPTPTNSTESPNVIEALIETILSQNTSGVNSSRAKSMLDDTFGLNDFSRIASAPVEDVAHAIRSGGLANKKAAVIQNILHSVHDKHGSYSLQHLASTEPGKRKTDAEIMEELVGYAGVGPKTASCVLLFCLGRDSFAVDTHVFRLSKILGWVPPKADRVLAQAHLDQRVPDELKYGLHVMMIQHGRLCKGCKREGGGGDCILKRYVQEKKGKSATNSCVVWDAFDGLQSFPSKKLL